MSDGISEWFDRLEEENGNVLNFRKKQETSLNDVIRMCQHHANMIKVHQGCLEENLEKLKNLV
jgi:hypothetical protein